MIYISHLLPDSEMKELIQETGAGVESIDFSVAENLDRLSETIRSYKKRLAFMGTDDLVIHGPFLDLNPITFDREILRVTRNRFEQAYEAAMELGAKKIVYHTGFHPEIYLLIGWADRMAEFFNSFLERRNEIQVVMENVFEREWKPLLEVKKKVDAPNFSLCLDIGHANCYSRLPVTVWAEGLACGIGHVHVHDNLGDRDSHLALGEGNIQIGQVLEHLEQNPACTYTLECRKKEDVRVSYKVLTDILGESNR